MPGWAATAPRERAEVLRAAHELLLAHADELAELITKENGKPIAEAKGEITYSADFFRWYSEEACRLAGQVSVAPAGGGRILTMLQPVGVAYLISPWNFPAAMLARKIAPALAAGCTAISKPAALTPLTAIRMHELCMEAGVPEGVLHTITTKDSKAVTKAILDDDRVRKLSFTGSTEVGRVLLRQCAERVVNTSMELGGNAPFLVFADADLDAAVEGAMVAKLRHNGETCTAANRFYVEASVAGEFAERFAARMAELKVGPGIDPDSQLGPLIDEDGREKVERLVQAALDGGADVVTGGRRPAGLDRGYFYEPTVLAGVAPGNPVLAEEIFGPVAPITAFEREDEAIDLANDSEYGLVAYVYTGDLARGLRVSEALESGMIGLNKGVVSDPAAPFGGVKQSGLGREGGHEGVLAFCEQKYIATNW
ncbi:MAG: NAD-dependent succinate-semialdehyde dehydrogenase [Acidimicrobiia bacterium]|nr:NAD-dependent succinate-semialdehyde dehydrogenase [Acidimicrobiia bacterium]